MNQFLRAREAEGTRSSQQPAIGEFELDGLGCDGSQAIAPGHCIRRFDPDCERPLRAAQNFTHTFCGEELAYQRHEGGDFGRQGIRFATSEPDEVSHEVCRQQGGDRFRVGRVHRFLNERCMGLPGEVACAGEVPLECRRWWSCWRLRSRRIRLGGGNTVTAAATEQGRQQEAYER